MAVQAIGLARDASRSSDWATRTSCSPTSGSEAAHILAPVRVQGQRRRRRETKTASTSPAPNAPSARRTSISPRLAIWRRWRHAPGVTLIPSADGGPAGFSVFGLDAAANSFTLNGLSMNGSTLPRDAAVSTTVATSPYDVSRGGFSGGQVTTRSQSGGNYIVRTMSLTGITPQMQWSDRAAQSLALESTNASISGRVLRTDQAQSRVLQRLPTSSTTTIAICARCSTSTRSGSKRSASRRTPSLACANAPRRSRTSVLRRRLSQPNKTQRGSLLGSFDYTPNSSQGHSLNLTVNGNWGRTLPMGFNSWDAPAHAGRSSNWAGSVQLRHTAYFKSVILSTTSFGFSANRERERAVSRAPSASVRITSDFADGSSNVRSILVGGNASLGSTSSTRTCSSETRCRGSAWTGSQAHAHHRAASQPVDDRSVVEPLRLVLVQLAGRLRGGRAVVVLTDAHAAAAGSEPGDARLVARRRMAPEPGSQSHLRRTRRREPLRFGAGVQPGGAAAFGLRNDRVPNPIAFSPRVGFSKTLGEVAADLHRRRLRARPTPAHRRRHRRVSGIARAVAHESRDLQYRAAERGPDAHVRRRRRADARLGELSPRSVERAEHLRRRHDGLRVRECAARRHARGSDTRRRAAGARI